LLDTQSALIKRHPLATFHEHRCADDCKGPKPRHDGPLRL
jgi:hypothetical protein